ncbi:hypothetical protein [Anabaena sp. UHCC 0451]|uniref:hypothetical protein n=1 Tax=Anabaena sp. UHCC 0451 TaxID=2055235 RepID=UPI002B207494|nr:hypothetical protein [Anabaena sp. UHCC 0451]MEA5577137.1 hypothetical protein [Anabaena sp. UHCC 0451]
MSLSKNLFCLPSLAALTILGSSLSATAQTTQSDTAVTPENQESTEISTTTVAEVPQFPNIATQTTRNRTITPFPGTVATSSTSLTSDENTKSPSQPSAAQISQPNQIAQSDIDLGRPTRGGSSYIGAGGNIGLSGGDSSLADGNFTVISKIGFTRSLSVRPSIILGDNTTFLIPLTYDFSFQQVGDPFTERLPIAPYVGVGAAIQTGDNSETAVMVTGGIDVPLNNRFTATAAVNAGFFNQTDIGLLVGVGYNFSGF